MGEAFLYGQGGSGGSVKFAMGEFIGTTANSENNYTQTVQLSTEFVPDYITILCVGRGTSTAYNVGYLVTLFYQRSTNSWDIVWGRGTSSESGMDDFHDLDSWGVDLTYNEEEGTLVFVGRSGGYSSSYFAFVNNFEYRWLMWKE